MWVIEKETEALATPPGLLGALALSPFPTEDEQP